MARLIDVLSSKFILSGEYEGKVNGILLLKDKEINILNSALMSKREKHL